MRDYVIFLHRIHFTYQLSPPQNQTILEDIILYKQLTKICCGGRQDSALLGFFYQSGTWILVSQILPSFNSNSTCIVKICNEN